MIKNLKAAFNLCGVIFIAAAMLGACAQNGTQRVPGGNRTQLQNMRTADYGRNNLVNNTTPYGANMDGTNRYGNQYGNGNLAGNNMTGNYNQGINTVPGNTNGTAGIAGNTGNTGNTGNIASDRKMADTIASQVRNLNGVRDCQTVVMGDTALVGFRPESGAADVNAIKSNIVKRVKAANKSIKNVTVSESSDIMSRIQRLGSDITKNRPANTIKDEFNKLIGELNPAR